MMRFHGLGCIFDASELQHKRAELSLLWIRISALYFSADKRPKLCLSFTDFVNCWGCYTEYFFSLKEICCTMLQITNSNFKGESLAKCKDICQFFFSSEKTVESYHCLKDREKGQKSEESGGLNWHNNRGIPLWKSMEYKMKKKRHHQC